MLFMLIISNVDIYLLSLWVDKTGSKFFTPHPTYPPTSLTHQAFRTHPKLTIKVSDENRPPASNALLRH
jgi:hypothetical protein